MQAKTVRKRFWTPDGLFVSEVVAKRNPAVISRKRSLPPDCKGLFLFRVDGDLYLKEGQDMILKAAQKYNIKTTWFININGYRDFPTAISQLLSEKLVELQSHGYHHLVYEDKTSNVANLSKAEEYLDRIVKRKVKGVVAPYGTWNPAFQQAMDELGYDYSSEFALSYDHPPFYPEINGRASSVLQIPIHPVCTGSFIFNRLPAAVACSYFERHIKERYLSGLPIILYGHPNDPDVEYNRTVINSIFKLIASLDGSKTMSFEEYYKWWISSESDKMNLKAISRGVPSDVNIPEYSFFGRAKYLTYCLSGFIKLSVCGFLKIKGKKDLVRKLKEIAFLKRWGGGS
jgi:hypothetical protein